MPTPGPLELVIILVIALLILGPGKLPDVGAALGKSIREFRKASTDVQDAVKLDTSPLPADPPAAPATAAVPAPPVPAAVSDPVDAPAAIAPAAPVAATASEPTAGSN
jgi:TatA/E family protein of Tat protein translocase